MPVLAFVYCVYFGRPRPPAPSPQRSIGRMIPALRRLSCLQGSLVRTEFVGFPGQETTSVLSDVVTVGVAAGPTGSSATAIRLTTAEGVADAGLPTAQAADFAGKAGALCLSYGASGSRVVAAGLGPAASCTSAGVRSAVAAAVSQLKKLKVSDATIELPTDTNIPLPRLAADIATAAILADYNFDIYITDAERKFHITSLTVLSADPAVAAAVALSRAKCAMKSAVCSASPYAPLFFLARSFERTTRPCSCHAAAAPLSRPNGE